MSSQADEPFRTVLAGGRAGASGLPGEEGVAYREWMVADGVMRDIIEEYHIKLKCLIINNMGI